jgi:hypothetical protein
MAFNEQLYRAAYAAIDNLITNGLPAPNGVVYTTALDYYNGYGKFQSGQEGFFTGSSDRDTITGSGAEVNGEGGLDVDLYGIDYNINIIATAKAVKTPGAKHFRWHLVNNQTGRVVCGYDFSTQTNIAQLG